MRQVRSGAVVSGRVGRFLICALAVLIALVLAAPNAAADVPARPATLIPAGSGWYCFRSHIAYNPSDRSSVCYRTAEACSNARSQPDSDEFSSTVAGECLQQAKVAGITYFDVMADEWRFWASHSSEYCAELHRFLANSPDRKYVSACQLIGDIVPPAARFNTRKLSPGEGWKCRRDEFGAWTRSGGQCSDEPGANKRCSNAAQAYVFTNESDDESLQALAFSTLAQCNQIRQRAALAGVADVSECSAVGDVKRPPIDRSLLTADKGWYCYTAKADGSVAGTCVRSQDDCDQTRGIDEGLGKVVTACTATRRAFVRADSGGLSAYTSIALCEQVMKLSSEGSRCESLE